MEQNKTENMTFESAMARLEEIVRALESGNTPLDTSLALCEEGV
ncbi:MAG: exodeoxyribonuclease VII small subunit, partial [Clostridia bacterium]|nr:exodeoxyribonuclease VII small subunit [Clostridia bacterium]